MQCNRRWASGKSWIQPLHQSQLINQFGLSVALNQLRPSQLQDGNIFGKHSSDKTRVGPETCHQTQINTR